MIFVMFFVGYGYVKFKNKLVYIDYILFIGGGHN
jgi:hypothetical protein